MPFPDYRLDALFIVINVADAAQKCSRFIPDIFHAMRFHGRKVDRISGFGDGLFSDFARIGIETPAFEATFQNIHGLVIKMIVDRNISAGLNRKIPQPVLRITMAVITSFAQPSDARADNFVILPLVGELVDNDVLTIGIMNYFHFQLPIRNFRNYQSNKASVFNKLTLT